MHNWKEATETSSWCHTLGLAIFGIEGSDKQEIKWKLEMTLRTVLGLLLMRVAVCVLSKYFRETSYRQDSSERRELLTSTLIS